MKWCPDRLAMSDTNKMFPFTCIAHFSLTFQRWHALTINRKFLVDSSHILSTLAQCQMLVNHMFVRWPCCSGFDSTWEWYQMSRWNKELEVSIVLAIVAAAIFMCYTKMSRCGKDLQVRPRKCYGSVWVVYATMFLGTKMLSFQLGDWCCKTSIILVSVIVMEVILLEGGGRAQGPEIDDKWLWNPSMIRWYYNYM